MFWGRFMGLGIKWIHILLSRKLGYFGFNSFSTGKNRQQKSWIKCRFPNIDTPFKLNFVTDKQALAGMLKNGLLILHIKILFIVGFTDPSDYFHWKKIHDWSSYYVNRINKVSTRRFRLCRVEQFSVEKGVMQRNFKKCQEPRVIHIIKLHSILPNFVHRTFDYVSEEVWKVRNKRWIFVYGTYLTGQPSMQEEISAMIVWNAETALIKYVTSAENVIYNKEEKWIGLFHVR